MKVTVGGAYWDGDEWIDCPVGIRAWNQSVEVTLERYGYGDPPVLLDAKFLEYALKVLKESPDFEESEEPT